MKQETYYAIKTEKDIQNFLDKTNGLHDAYLTSVCYSHNGHSGRNPHLIDDKQTELRLRFLITSIHDAEVEIVFSEVSEWNIYNNGFEVPGTSVSFTDQGKILWKDDDIEDAGSFVVAQEMMWKTFDHIQ